MYVTSTCQPRKKSWEEKNRQLLGIQPCAYNRIQIAIAIKVPDLLDQKGSKFQVE